MEAATSSKAGTGRVACSAMANQQRYYFNCTNSKRIVPQPCGCQTTFSEGGGYATVADESSSNYPFPFGSIRWFGN